MTFKEFWTQFFTWWNGQTLGTRFWTWRHGEFVGQDEFGNRYYRSKTAAKIDPSMQDERRWVIYNGVADASAVSPGWVGWMRHTFVDPPTAETYVPRPWEMAHVPNMTGTPHAYRPKGSLL